MSALRSAARLDAVLWHPGTVASGALTQTGGTAPARGAPARGRAAARRCGSCVAPRTCPRSGWGAAHAAGSKQRACAHSCRGSPATRYKWVEHSTQTSHSGMHLVHPESHKLLWNRLKSCTRADKSGCTTELHVCPCVSQGSTQRSTSYRHMQTHHAPLTCTS